MEFLNIGYEFEFKTCVQTNNWLGYGYGFELEYFKTLVMISSSKPVLQQPIGYGFESKSLVSLMSAHGPAAVALGRLGYFDLPIKIPKDDIKRPAILVQIFVFSYRCLLF